MGIEAGLEECLTDYLTFTERDRATQIVPTLSLPMPSKPSPYRGMKYN